MSGFFAYVQSHWSQIGLGVSELLGVVALIFPSVKGGALAQVVSAIWPQPPAPPAV